MFITLCKNFWIQGILIIFLTLFPMRMGFDLMYTAPFVIVLSNFFGRLSHIQHENLTKETSYPFLILIIIFYILILYFGAELKMIQNGKLIQDVLNQTLFGN